MAFQGMLNKRRNKIMRGGDVSDTAYSISSYILLFISYIFFGFATILLINTGDNYNKANIDENAVNRGDPLIKQPIFEYLKRDTFMAIEEFLLGWNKPVFIIFSIVIGVCLLAIFIIKGQNISAEVLYGKTILYGASYILMITIFIPYTFITASNNNDLNVEKENLFNYTALNDHLKRKEDKRIFFKELKGVVLDMLDKNVTYSDSIKNNIADILFSKLPSTFKDGNVGDITNENIKAILYTTETNFDIGIDNISTIFNYRTAYLGEYNEYKNYIDNLFNLIMNDNEPKSNNLYIKYYLDGLKRGAGGNDDIIKLKDKLKNIKKRIQDYCIVVWAFYGFFFLVVLGILGYYNQIMNFLTIYRWDIMFKVIPGISLIYIPIFLTMYYRY